MAKFEGSTFKVYLRVINASTFDCEYKNGFGGMWRLRGKLNDANGLLSLPERTECVAGEGDYCCGKTVSGTSAVLMP
ncbi:MAG: hypothetical protein L0287_33125, partial [Anaerolineae bacterium]|nr:hypothetical protein [Anaerolineae bacterium]